jgi:hypothetical protein
MRRCGFIDSVSSPLFLYVRFQFRKCEKFRAWCGLQYHYSTKGKKEKIENKVSELWWRRSSNHLRMGLVGLPNVGKSSTFNFLTRLNVPAENYPFCTIGMFYFCCQNLSLFVFVSCMLFVVVCIDVYCCHLLCDEHYSEFWYLIINYSLSFL